MHADLSVRYTDHCVRDTSVVLLKKAGFEDREVCFITGHSNPKSLSSYSQPDEEMKAKMALALDTKPISKNSTSLVVSLSENTNEKETSNCAQRTGWNSPQRRSTTPPLEILPLPRRTHRLEQSSMLGTAAYITSRLTWVTRPTGAH